MKKIILLLFIVLNIYANEKNKDIDKVIELIERMCIPTTHKDSIKFKGNISLKLLDLKKTGLSTDVTYTKEEIKGFTNKLNKYSDKQITETRDCMKLYIPNIINIILDINNEINYNNTVKNVNNGKLESLGMLDKYRQAIEKLPVVELFIKKTDYDIKKLYDKYPKFNEEITKDELLDSMYKICNLYDFHFWFMKKEIYDLPINLLRAMNKYFSTVSTQCKIVNPSIITLQKDDMSSLFFNNEHLYLDTEYSYRNIISNSALLLNLFDKEKQKIIQSKYQKTLE